MRAGERSARQERENGLRDQQVVGEIEVLRQPSTGKPLENLAITIHNGTQAIAERLVLALRIIQGFHSRLTTRGRHRGKRPGARDAPNPDQVLATERGLTSTEKTEVSICSDFVWAVLGSNP